MTKQWIGAAIAGACLVAAAPAAAENGEAGAAATPSSVTSYSAQAGRAPSLVTKANHPVAAGHQAGPDVFGTVALKAGVTFYDARFRRVSTTDSNDPMVMRLATPAIGLDPIAKLQMVQREVNHQVRWMHDLDNMGVADFWSNAGETLHRGTGDSEDIAIAKMQVLKAAGFNPNDLYISIGRHNVRGAHVLLLARTASGFYVLDDTMQDITTPSQHGRFTPIMTLGPGISWIHGRRVAGPRGTTGRIARASSTPNKAKAD